MQAAQMHGPYGILCPFSDFLEGIKFKYAHKE